MLSEQGVRPTSLLILMLAAACRRMVWFRSRRFQSVCLTMADDLIRAHVREAALAHWRVGSALSTMLECGLTTRPHRGMLGAAVLFSATPCSDASTAAPLRRWCSADNEVRLIISRPRCAAPRVLIPIRHARDVRAAVKRAVWSALQRFTRARVSRFRDMQRR